MNFKNNRKVKAILLGLFALTVAANINAQTNCATAIDALINTNQAPAQNELWYTFSPDGQSLASYSVDYNSKSFDVGVEIFSGSCSNLTPVSAMNIYGEIPAIPGDANTYYIHFVWNGTPQAFSWELRQHLLIPMTGISVTPKSANLTFGERFRIDTLFTIGKLPENTTEYPAYEIILPDSEGILENVSNDLLSYNSTLRAIGSGTAKLIFNAPVFRGSTYVSAGVDTVTINIAAPAPCALATTVNAGANTAQEVQEQWFRFTAGKTGIYTVNHGYVTPGGDKISVDWTFYKGDCDNLRKQEAVFVENATTAFHAEAGQTYSIKLYQYGLTAFDWTLNVPTSVTGFSLTTRQLELTLPDGSCNLADLGLNFTPADATDKGVDIAVRDDGVVELFEDGQAIVYKDAIRALREGSTHVVFTARDGGFKDSCLVTVKYVPLNSFSLSMREKTLWLPYSYRGEIIAIDSLGLTFLPANATDRSYTVAVRNKAIVKHVPGSYGSGYLQAGREGSTYAVFTATDGGLKDSILIHVTRTASGGSPCENATVAQLGDNDMPAAENFTRWFTFTPAESGNYALTNKTDKYPETSVEIYTGHCDSLYLIQDGDMLGGSYLHGAYQLGFYAEAGETCHLKVTTLDYNVQGGGEIIPYAWMLVKFSASISGTVTDNGAPAQGEVELYAYRGQNEAVFRERTGIQANGSYSFSNLGAERYFVKAVTATGSFAYSGNTQEWKSADVVSPLKSEACTGIDIAVVHPEAVSEGTAKISGYVFSTENVQAGTIRRAASLRSSSGSPAANVAVLLQRNASAITYTRTNAEGYFEFTGIGAGAYAVVIDIPGLEMEELTTVNITEDAQSVELAYEVSEAGIFNNTTGIETPETGTAIRIFPSPATSELYISGAENAALTVLNLQGQIIYTCGKLSARETVPVSTWASGVYLVRIQAEKDTTVGKIVKR
jgi:uncharacterized protein YjdB